MVRGMFVASTPQPVQEKVLKTMLGTPEATANGAMQAMFSWMATSDRTIRDYPVLGIYADGSRAGNAETSKRIYPAYEHQEIPGTGHFLMMERPAEFNRRLIQFLDRVK